MNVEQPHYYTVAPSLQRSSLFVRRGVGGEIDIRIDRTHIRLTAGNNIMTSTSITDARTLSHGWLPQALVALCSGALPTVTVIVVFGLFVYMTSVAIHLKQLND